MQQYDILSRASVTPIQSTVTDRVHLLTSAHVLSPWLYRNYYPDEWLDFVTEKHTKYTLEIRNPEGAILSQHSLSNEVFHHPTRDLACLHFADEFASFVEMARAGEEQIFEPLQMAGKCASEDSAVEFLGHRNNVEMADSGDDVSMQEPLCVSGIINWRSDKQVESSLK